MTEATRMLTNINKEEITYILLNSVIYCVTCTKSIMHVITKTDSKRKRIDTWSSSHVYCQRPTMRRSHFNIVWIIWQNECNYPTKFGHSHLWSLLTIKEKPYMSQQCDNLLWPTVTIKVIRIIWTTSQNSEFLRCLIHTNGQRYWWSIIHKLLES